MLSKELLVEVLDVEVLDVEVLDVEVFDVKSVNSTFGSGSLALS